MSQVSPALRPSVGLSLSKPEDTQEAGLSATTPRLPWGCRDSGRQPISRKRQKAVSWPLSLLTGEGWVPWTP